jgi:hypothetical protein
MSEAGAAGAQRRIAVELTPQAIEGIAVRVAALLRAAEPDDAAEQPRLITAGELAHQLRVQRPWIYRHRELLGGRRMGVGPRAPWRFELDTARKALELCRNSRAPGANR